MEESIDRISRVADLEARQDAVLHDLEELERRIELAIRESQPGVVIPIAPIINLPIPQTTAAVA